MPPPPAGPDGGPDGGASPDRRVTNEFLAYIDGIQGGAGNQALVVVIAATNNPWHLDEAALSR
jgi:SpoVK/Ycf46/Vps4 family AAA+-type ATPase